MEIQRDAVCIFIPTLNEAPTIGELVDAFKKQGFSHILVVDGHSTDRTPKIAAEHGAEVWTQSGKGKGDAIIEAIAAIQQPYILMLDGDGTYLPEEADSMLSPLFEGFDHVIGNRLAHPEDGALSRFNRFGNEIINYLFKIAHGTYLTDILSGYRAFSTESAKDLHLKEEGFEIETEMASESLRNQQKIEVIPIHYLPRPGTPTKLHPVRDGWKIIKGVWRFARNSNPLFYFGIFGVISLILGVLLGLWVILEWFNRVTHTELTILTMLLIVVGIQIFMFGVIADMMVTFNRETRQEILRLKGPGKP